MALILLRHTTVDVEPGVCYGQTDLDLAATFETEAEEVLAGLPFFARMVTSPLRRCRRLADVISAQFQIPVEEDSRLMEMDFGSWEGQSWSTIPRVQINAWAADFFHARPHGGESVAMLRARTQQAVKDCRRSGEPTLIVTHAGVVRAALSTGETADDFNAEIDFGGFVTISDTQGALHE